MELSAKPTFVIWKAGEKKATVNGVLINEIETKVHELLPALDDWSLKNIIHWFDINELNTLP